MSKAARRSRGHTPSPALSAGASVSNRLRAMIRAWTVPVLLVVSVQTLVGQTYRIPTGSMKPAMLVGDWLAVNKLAYGAHIPFTTVSLPGYDAPARGDIVVFQSPYQADEAAIGNDPRVLQLQRRRLRSGAACTDRHPVAADRAPVPVMGTRRGWA